MSKISGNKVRIGNDPVADNNFTLASSNDGTLKLHRGNEDLAGDLLATFDANGRFDAKLRDFVSVKDFGAVGDGVTDDTAAINAAIDYVASLGGGTVFVPSGIYMVQMLGGWVRLKSKVSLIGDGVSSVIKGIPIDGASNFVYCISLVNVEDITIRGLLIDGNKPAGELDEKQWHGIRLGGNSKKVLIENNQFKGFKGDGIWIVKDGTTDGNPPSESIIRNNRFSDCNRQDIALVEGENILMEGNSGTGALDIEADTVSYINHGHTVINNIFQSILVSPLCDLANGERDNINVIGNTCDNMFLWGCNGTLVSGNIVKNDIKLAYGGTITVSNNACKNISQAVANGQSILNAVIKGNTVEGSTVSGVSLYNCINATISNNFINSTGPSIYIDRVYTSAVSGEVCVRDNRLVSDSGDGVYVNVPNPSQSNVDIIISNNNIQCPDSGIEIAGSSRLNNLIIESNYFKCASLILKQANALVMRNNLHSNVSTFDMASTAPRAVYIEGERFLGAIPTINFTNAKSFTGPVVISDISGVGITIGNGKLEFFGVICPEIFLDNIVSSSATPFANINTANAPIRIGSNIKITGDSAKYGVWFNGTSWVNKT